MVPQTGTMFGDPPLPPPLEDHPPLPPHEAAGSLGTRPAPDLVRRHDDELWAPPLGPPSLLPQHAPGGPGDASIAYPPGEPRVGGEPQDQAKFLAGRFLQSLKDKHKDKKAAKDIQGLLAKRAAGFNKSSSSGSNEQGAVKPAAMNDDVWAQVCHQLGICPDGTDLDADGMNVGKKKKKKKKHKHKSKHRSKGSSYTSSTSSSRSSSPFRLPSSRAAGRENAIAECARKNPGKLFTEGLRTMARYCDPSAGSGGGDNLPASAYRYLTTLVSAAQGMNLKQRDQRELQTLAICCDHLARGNTAGLGDILMQRFKAVEAAHQKSWDYAKQFELVPEQQFQTASVREQEVAAKMSIRDSQLQRSLKLGREEGRYPKGNE